MTPRKPGARARESNHLRRGMVLCEAPRSVWENMMQWIAWHGDNCISTTTGGCFEQGGKQPRKTAFPVTLSVCRDVQKNTSLARQRLFMPFTRTHGRSTQQLWPWVPALLQSIERPRGDGSPRQKAAIQKQPGVRYVCAQMTPTCRLTSRSQMPASFTAALKISTKPFLRSLQLLSASAPVRNIKMVKCIIYGFKWHNLPPKLSSQRV